jgi:hypothetical protein
MQPMNINIETVKPQNQELMHAQTDRGGLQHSLSLAAREGAFHPALRGDPPLTHIQIRTRVYWAGSIGTTSLLCPG